MKDFLLIFSTPLAASPAFCRHIQAQLLAAGIAPAYSARLRENDALMNCLLAAYELDWQRCIAFCDEATFAALNSALATTLNLELELKFDYACIAKAEHGAKFLHFKAAVNSSEREFYLIKQTALQALDEQLLRALTFKCHTATLLGYDAASAQILLRPAAAACAMEISVSAEAPKLCKILATEAKFSDPEGFFAQASGLFGAQFFREEVFARLLSILRARGLKIAAAESCTAGQFAAKFCANEGASEAFLGGFVVYSRAAKRAWLGVKSLAGAAVYSAECARELAAGAMAKSGAELGVGITGVLGAAADEGAPRGRVQICVLWRASGDAAGGAQAGGGGEQLRELNESVLLDASRECMQEQAALCAAANCLRLLES